MKNKISFLAKNTEPRCERKFFIPGPALHYPKSLIKLHPACFKKSFPQRQVNNTYLDSFDFKDYQDNLIGASRRFKSRIRWYGKNFNKAINPFLEIKFKDNAYGKKIYYPLENFTVDKNLNKNLRILIHRSSMPEILRLYLLQLRVSSLNSYSRQYYLSANKKFRLTLDFDLSFYKLNGKLFEHDKNNYILELKYNYKYDEDGRNISAKFPYRITKNSKYAMGVAKMDYLLPS